MRQIVKVSAGPTSNLSFYLKNKTGALQGEKLGSLISLLSSSTGLT